LERLQYTSQTWHPVLDPKLNLLLYSLLYSLLFYSLLLSKGRPSTSTTSLTPLKRNPLHPPKAELLLIF